MDPGTIIAICAAPGQLFKAAIALKNLYDAFFDQDRNATSEAREFAQLISTFAIALVNQGRLIKRAGEFLPGEENFKKTIQQCALYLQRYESLLREQPPAARKAIDTTMWQRDESGERKKLVDKLNLHINFMNSCSMKVLLEIALKDRDATRLSSSPAIEPATIEDHRKLRASQDQYNKLYIKAVSLQYAQKRDRRYEQDPELVMRDLNQIIEQWRTILVDSGMPEGSLPKAPRYSKKDTKDSIIWNWRRGMEREYQMHSRSISPSSRAGSLTPRSRFDGESGAATPRSSRQASIDIASNIAGLLSDPGEHSSHHDAVEALPGTLSTSPGIESATDSRPPSLFSPNLGARRRSSRWSDGTMSTTGSLGRLSLSDMEVAKVRWSHHDKDYEAQLYTYVVDDSRRPRSITWNKGQPEQIEHRLGKPFHPFTKHATFKKSLEVSLLEEQVIIRDHKAYKTFPTYTFTDEREFRLFQQSVYNRELLGTFDTEKIATKADKQGEATVQHIKLWKSWDTQRHYLTYYANVLEPKQKHRELRVDWFDRPNNDRGSTSSFVKLNLHKRPAPPPSTRRLSGLSFDTLKPRAKSISSVSSDQQSRRTSTIAPSVADENGWPACPDNLLKLGYVEIHFATGKVRNEFVTAFNLALDDSFAGTTSPTIPELPPQSDLSDTSSLSSIDSFKMQRATPSSVLGLPASLLGTRPT